MDTMYIITGNYSRLSIFFNDNTTLLRRFLKIDMDKNVKKSYQLFVIEEFMRKGGF